MTQSQIQLGKNKITDKFAETLKNNFKKHDNVKVSVLKSAGHDREKIKEYSREILEKLGKNHIDLASEQLQKDRVIKIIYSASYHLRLVCAALARIIYLTGEPWHSTSTLYEQYNKILDSKIKPLSYRRISELLVELQNTGIATSQTGSKGRHGYGTQYKLLISPEMIGKACFDEWWKSVVKQKIEHEAAERQREIWEPLGKRGHSGFGVLSKQLNNISNENWKKYVGLD